MEMLPPMESCIPDDPYYENIIAAKSLLDGREVHLIRMTFNLRLAVTDEPKGVSYEDIYCYHLFPWAWIAFDIWDGETVPPMWAKHPMTGAYGPGCLTSDPETHVQYPPGKEPESKNSERIRYQNA